MTEVRFEKSFQNFIFFVNYEEFRNSKIHLVWFWSFSVFFYLVFVVFIRNCINRCSRYFLKTFYTPEALCIFRIPKSDYLCSHVVYIGVCIYSRHSIRVNTVFYVVFTGPDRQGSSWRNLLDPVQSQGKGVGDMCLPWGRSWFNKIHLEEESSQK